MDTEHCREFLELSQKLNFTEAANHLGITQSALSKHILTMERELGTTLLERGNKGVIRLTEGGKIFFERANAIVERYDDGVAEINKLKVEGPIRVGGHLNDPDVAPFLSVVAMIAKEEHTPPLILKRGIADSCVDAFGNDEVDLFIGYADPDKAQKAGLVCHAFASSRLIAIMETSHPLAQRASIRMEDLKNQILIHFAGNTTNTAWSQIEALCLNHGFSPKTSTISETDDIGFFTTPLQERILIWKQSQKHIALLLETGYLSCVPIENDDAHLTTYAIYRTFNEQRLEGFLIAVEHARTILDRRKIRKNTQMAN